MASTKTLIASATRTAFGAVTFSSAFGAETLAATFDETISHHAKHGRVADAFTNALEAQYGLVTATKAHNLRSPKGMLGFANQLAKQDAVPAIAYSAKDGKPALGTSKRVAQAVYACAVILLDSGYKGELLDAPAWMMPKVKTPTAPDIGKQNAARWDKALATVLEGIKAKHAFDTATMQGLVNYVRAYDKGQAVQAMNATRDAIAKASAPKADKPAKTTAKTVKAKTATKAKTVAPATLPHAPAIEALQGPDTALAAAESGAVVQ